MRKPINLAIFCISCLAIISMACSFPFFQTQEEEIVIPTLPPAATNTEAVAVEEDKAVSTSTIAPTTVVTKNVDWDGKWKIWMGDSSKGYTIDFLVQGDKISGTTVITNHNSISFIGIIQEDGGTIEGTWENTDGTSGDFYMYIDSSEDVFTGRLSSSSAFCGNRASSTQPSPCFE